MTLLAQPSLRCIPSKSRWIASSIAPAQAQLVRKLARHTSNSPLSLASFAV